MQIDKLTPEQEAMFPQYVDRFVKLALQKDGKDEDAREITRNFYTNVDLKPPSQVEIFPDPFMAFHYVDKLKDGDDKAARRILEASKGGLRERKKIMKDAKNLTFLEPVFERGYCGWIAYYAFFFEQFGICEQIKPFIDAMERGMFWHICLEDLGLAIRAPKMSLEFEREQYVFHSEKGPAVDWGPYARYWYLHGIEVPRWLAETPGEELDPGKFGDIENVEVRREFVRKIGIERMLEKLPHKVLDTEGDYQVLRVNVIEDSPRIYLKMKNPSIGVWHMEAVPPNVRTVREAIDARAASVLTKGENWDPEILT